MSWFVLLLAFQVTPELRQHVEAGLKAKTAGDLQTAVREFQQVTKLAPEMAAAHVNLGAVYLADQNYGAATASLRRALELNADLPGAHSMLGTSLLAQGYALEAIPHLQKSDSHDLLGVALLETGKVREAVDRLETALNARPNDPDLLYYLGHAHDRLARQMFERLRREGPDSPRSRQMNGEVLVGAGKSLEAEKHFRAALSTRPNLRGVHLALGELLIEAGDYQRAEAELLAETRLAPGSAVAAYKLGVVLAHGGRTSEAVETLLRADKLQPEMPETLLELGKALSASGKVSEAEKYLQKVVTVDDGGTLAEAAHFQLSNVYRRLGRPKDAARELSRFQELRKKRSR